MSESTVGNDPTRKRFLLGVALGWFSLIPFLYGWFNAMKGISETKATGIGAIAGGIAEGCAILGALAFLLSPIIAIYLLVTSWSRGKLARNLLSVVTMLWSGFTLLLILGTVWLFSVFPHRLY